MAQGRCVGVGASLADGIVASAVVWLAALPLVALRFHLVSPIGILLNIPLIPLTSAAMLLGGLSLVLSAAWGPLGGPLAWAAARLLTFDPDDRPLGGRAAARTSLRRRPRLGMGAGLLRDPRAGGPGRDDSRLAFRSRAGGPAGSIGAASGGSWQPGSFPAGCSPAVRAATAALQAEFLAVGHGLAVLIHTPDGQTLLYDCGRLGDPTVGRRIIAPALWARGVSRIDTVFLSHADQDHYDGLPDLLDRFPIGEVRLPPEFAGVDNPMATRLIEQLRVRGVPVRPITAPRSWEQAGVQFTVSHPPDGLAPGSLRQRP